MNKYFGTDGVRGCVGEAPMTVDFALRLASAAARVLAPGGGRVLIGKDTRVSGYMFESALEAGFVAAGVDVMLIGPLPTPGIAYMTQRLGCSFGVVISASHNAYQDNGIKFFDATGSKLSDDAENEIECLLDLPVVTRESKDLGKAIRIDRSRTQYQQFCASTIPAGMNLKGFKIVIDCANGAGYKVAPRVLADLGAEIVPIGCSPNGRNINDGCGSTAPELLQLTVPGVRAQLGMALDGDGDRVVMVDALGRCVDGDQMLYILAKHGHDRDELKGPVVGTVMSNLGLEHGLAEIGVKFSRAQVGDRYVLAMLNDVGGTLGGETSGHILCLDKTTTGDGLISALQVLAVMKQTGAGLAELAAGMRKYPQVLLNVRVAKRFDPLQEPAVLKAAQEVERRFDGRGRIVLRASGTEPVIRVMVEGDDADLVKKGARDIASVVEAAAATAKDTGT
ncbi:MAG TPA: phosphoglucosamine mutase [Steroidobacteraceae bacterium]|nr:phosphoglucosamine mutase [Steroidobacteraceae bacterium]